MKPYVSVVNGRTCVADSSPLFDKPVMITNHWPLDGASALLVSNMEGHEVEKAAPYGYMIRIAPYQWEPLRLADGGKTQAIFQDVNPIPKPKTKVETRYKNGRWEKLLKSKGWTPA